VIERSSIADCPLDLWHQIINVNLTSAFLVTQAAIPSLRAGGNGAIVNLLSLRSRPAAPTAPGCTGLPRAALQVMTRTLARELAPLVRTNSIMPGVVETRHHEEFTTPQRMESYRKETPLGRNARRMR